MPLRCRLITQKMMRNPEHPLSSHDSSSILAGVGNRTRPLCYCDGIMKVARMAENKVLTSQEFQLMPVVVQFLSKRKSPLDSPASYGTCMCPRWNPNVLTPSMT